MLGKWHIFLCCHNSIKKWRCSLRIDSFSFVMYITCYYWFVHVIGLTFSLQWFHFSFEQFQWHVNSDGGNSFHGNCFSISWFVTVDTYQKHVNHNWNLHLVKSVTKTRNRKRETGNGKRETGKWKMGTRQKIGNKVTDRARVQDGFCSHLLVSRSRARSAYPVSRSIPLCRKQAHLSQKGLYMSWFTKQ